MINTNGRYQRHKNLTWHFYANRYRISRYIISLFHSSVTPRGMFRVMLWRSQKSLRRQCQNRIVRSALGRPRVLVVHVSHLSCLFKHERGNMMTMNIEGSSRGRRSQGNRFYWCYSVNECSYVLKRPCFYDCVHFYRGNRFRTKMIKYEWKSTLHILI